MSHSIDNESTTPVDRFSLYLYFSDHSEVVVEKHLAIWLIDCHRHCFPFSPKWHVQVPGQGMFHETVLSVFDGH